MITFTLKGKNANVLMFHFKTSWNDQNYEVNQKKKNDHVKISNGTLNLWKNGTIWIILQDIVGL